MFVLAFVNQKGGCGKTTAAVNLAGALAALGRRVLLVDLDPQAHATLALGAAPAPSAPTSFDLLAGEASIEDVEQSVAGDVWIAPASLELAQFEEISARLIEPEQRLRAVLEEVRDVYDFVLIDCPPRADGVLTANALNACDCAILVVETGAFALQGALAAQRILEEKLAGGERRFDVRVLATMFNRRLRIAREILIAMQARFGERLFQTAIRESVRLRECAALGAPVQVVDPSSRSVQDFASLAHELIELRSRRAREQASLPRSSAPRIEVAEA